jgi:hypothetical protein
MSPEIKQNPPLECPQLKTIRTTPSTSFRCAGKCCEVIEARTCTCKSDTMRIVAKLEKKGVRILSFYDALEGLA